MSYCKIGGGEPQPGDYRLVRDALGFYSQVAVVPEEDLPEDDALGDNLGDDEDLGDAIFAHVTPTKRPRGRPRKS